MRGIIRKPGSDLDGKVGIVIGQTNKDFEVRVPGEMRTYLIQKSELEFQTEEVAG